MRSKLDMAIILTHRGAQANALKRTSDMKVNGWKRQGIGSRMLHVIAA
jgi:hypothetical protein